MKPIFIQMKTQLFCAVGCFAVLFVFSTCATAQTDLPYYTGFDNATQQQGWTQYRTGDEGDFNEWYYVTINTFSAPQSLYHNYPVGGSEVTDDWYVSPAFDFSGGGMIDSLRYHFSGFGTPFGIDTVGIYLLNGAQDPEIASRSLLFSFHDTTYVNDNVWRKLENVEIPATSGESYIAFRYTTVVNWLDVRFDNLAISGNSDVGIDQPGWNENVLTVFPNPAKDYATLSFSENIVISRTELIGMTGKVIRTYPGNSYVLDFSEVTSGQYVLKVFSERGVIVHKILIE